MAYPGGICLCRMLPQGVCADGECQPRHAPHRQRLVPVSLPLPEYHKQQVTRDTSSVLENGLYRSVASFHDGMLTHTLENLPGAAVEGKGAVHDTIRITTRDKEHKHYREKPKVVYKEKELSWVEKAAMKTGFVAFCLALISIVYFVVRWKLK